jgi:hypothetical protein
MHVVDLRRYPSGVRYYSANCLGPGGRGFFWMTGAAFGRRSAPAPAGLFLGAFNGGSEPPSRQDQPLRRRSEQDPAKGRQPRSGRSAHLLACCAFVRGRDDDSLNQVDFPDVGSVIDWSQQPMCHGAPLIFPSLAGIISATQVESRARRTSPTERQLGGTAPPRGRSRGRPFRLPG